MCRAPPHISRSWRNSARRASSTAGGTRMPAGSPRPPRLWSKRAPRPARDEKRQREEQTMAKLCAGRVCIITGAGRGIGREYALMLAAHGAKVVVNDLGGARDGTGSSLGPAEEVVEEIVKAGGEAKANGDDVSDFAGAAHMIQDAISAFGKLDVLVNNAGILRDRMLINMTEAEWDAVIKVHLKGTFSPAHHAAAYWRELVKGGQKVDARLINTTSVSGIYGNAGQTNYGAAKAGI